MQHRMKEHQLDKSQIETMLNCIQTGTIATINLDSTPYVVPVHFVYLNDKIYFHGLPKGKKIENIKFNHNVCFNIYEMYGIVLDQDKKICDTNTKYQSVVILGTAKIIEDLKVKEEVLNKIIVKYTPDITNYEIPQNMIKGTAIIEINIDQITGKYY
ncbi:pyridoxamine 5'-phosphate oxidase family protein [Clostridioides mangenotii]|uniref:pyridoxamine 5'-phosphate oxidase family protein n=1 Tax=Metaclostridioides mangenotii TaxID=1540 RepID=UPI001C112C85|nr:pyridoxamine 5'-phosphate oxidase family protein [Clostridioides mangenotii]MBU5307687.1 pyridoxamine 5'-phosphate oxidase family protein [Clostridioides mangenotii]MCR1955871.1 pyridoxamine 5'-phosphate oxidase family protein [Clostridioides mangenotii]